MLIGYLRRIIIINNSDDISDNEVNGMIFWLSNIKIIWHTLTIPLDLAAVTKGAYYGVLRDVASELCILVINCNRDCHQKLARYESSWSDSN